MIASLWWVQLLLSMGFGALIGYVTNALAIKMLFRPYKAVYWGTFRLPFTPGIIPKQKDKLAASVAGVVRNQLFNETAITKHLEAPEVQNRVFEAILSLLGGHEEQRQAELSWDLLGTEAEIRTLASRVLQAFFSSPGLIAGIRGTGLAMAGFLESIPLQSLVPRDEEFKKIVDQLTLLSRSDASKQHIEALLKRGLVTIFEDTRALEARIDTQGLLTLSGLAFDTIYPLATRELLSWVQTKEIKKELVLRGRAIVAAAFAKLSGPQRLLAGLAGYEKTLVQSMPSLVDETIQELEKALVQGGIATSLRSFLLSWLSQLMQLTPGEAASRFGLNTDEARETFLAYARDFILQAGTDLQWFDRIRTSFLEYGDKSLGDFFFELTGSRLETFGNYAAERFSTWLSAAETGPRLLNLTIELASHYSKPQVRNESQLSKHELTMLSQQLTALATRVLKVSIPYLLQEFDLEALVRRRLLDLDMKELEALILSLSKRELAWINYLGGLLGALIGAVQVLANMLKRG